MLASARSLTIVLWLALCGGCAGRNRCDSATDCAPTGLPADGCRPVERQIIQPDVAAAAPLSTVANIAGDGRLCALEEKTAQCLAASHATIANLLDLEAEAADAQPSGWCLHSGSSALTGELLRLEATQKRNLAAGDALQVFLRLVEAEGGVDNLQRRGQEIDTMLADVDRVQQRGLLSPVSKPELAAQRLELWHRQVELRSTVQQLNSRLLELLGTELAAAALYWPETSLVVTTDVPDKDDSIGFALANRADLAALRLAANADGADSLAAARTLLQLAGGGLGAPAAKAQGRLGMLLHPHATERDQSARSQQLADLLSDRQRTVRQETLLAVSTVEAQLVQIGLTRRRLEVAKEHLQAMEDQQRLAEGGAFSVHKARLDAIAVEQDLLHDVIEWKLALVKLKQAEGLLAIECGYDAVARCAPGRACLR